MLSLIYGARARTQRADNLAENSCRENVRRGNGQRDKVVTATRYGAPNAAL